MPKMLKELLEEEDKQVIVGENKVSKVVFFPKRASEAYFIFLQFLKIQKYCPNPYIVPVLEIETMDYGEDGFGIAYTMPKLKRLSDNDIIDPITEKWHFDAHRGNFMKNSEGRIVAIDLEGIFALD